MIHGHGHVIPRRDGAKAQCGGPAICSICQEEARTMDAVHEQRQAAESSPPARSGLRLGVLQEQRLRAWPTERIRPKSVALGVLSLLAEVDALRAALAEAQAEQHQHLVRADGHPCWCEKPMMDLQRELAEAQAEHAECDTHIRVLIDHRDHVITRLHEAQLRADQLEWIADAGLGRIDSLSVERDAALEQAEAMAEAIGILAKTPSRTHFCCPWCDGALHLKHDDACPLGAVLSQRSEAGAVETTADES